MGLLTVGMRLKRCHAASRCGRTSSGRATARRRVRCWWDSARFGLECEILGIRVTTCRRNKLERPDVLGNVRASRIINVQDVVESELQELWIINPLILAVFSDLFLLVTQVHQSMTANALLLVDLDRWPSCAGVIKSRAINKAVS